MESYEWAILLRTSFVCCFVSFQEFSSASGQISDHRHRQMLSIIAALFRPLLSSTFVGEPSRLLLISDRYLVSPVSRSMSASKNTIIRRTPRRSIPTERAKEYMEQRNLHRPSFPNAKDEICVKWVLDNRVIWWPATVVSIQPIRGGQRVCRGTLLYQKLGNYGSEHASVQFFFSVSNERIVRSVNYSSSTKSGRHDESEASWVFVDEFENEEDKVVRSTMEESEEPNSRNVQQRSSSSSRIEMLGASSCAVNDNSRATYQSKGTTAVRSNGVSGSSRRIKSEVRHIKSTISKPPRSKTTSKKEQVTPRSRTESSFPEAVSDVQDEIQTGLAHEVNQSRSISLQEKDEINIRLQLIERQFEDVKGLKRSNLSTSAQSVIDSLRWAFLRNLEKPLKPLNIPELSEYGLGRHEMVVTVQCDYYTFRELAASLAREHPSGLDDQKQSRVAFSPSFATTQSGSSAADNMNVIFSCLADLTTFLRIRDDNDFEGILSKEILTETSTMLRILGTFTVEKDTGSHRQPKSATNSTSSISASSDIASAIKIFIGLSPIDYVEVPTRKAYSSNESGPDHSTFITTIFQQDCKHFCEAQKCFRTQWKSQHARSNLSVRSSFHLDGTVSKGELKKYFMINWSRQPAPSTIKWTRDVHDTGNNCPGNLRLIIPFIYCTSNRNVQSLVSLLDVHIETIMKVRSRIHNLSSSK